MIIIRDDAQKCYDNLETLILSQNIVEERSLIADIRFSNYIEIII